MDDDQGYPMTQETSEWVYDGLWVEQLQWLDFASAGGSQIQGTLYDRNDKYHQPKQGIDVC